ncbi:hypothetical protein [Reichenbachiella sp. MSK19-1]|uniref:hypothetical protein n=1 Tax=Reichenbachiella sp. MSK19-1 TaxID=1897631 RepID=UPI000E6D2334|nr:hypothetical protein [Reichenbachiella sp. MSK19-1]RJE74845.1 hypothetical protein BGP76_17110 [Reichenbachiella sp. MSK19-1]
MKTAVNQAIWTELLESDKPVVKVIEKSENLRILGIGLKQGVILTEHQTPYVTKLVLVEGEVEYEQGETKYLLRKFDELDIPVNIKHQVTSLSNSLFVLIQELNAGE